MLIQKRDGRMEPFDMQKLKNSLAITADELGQPLNESDLSSIAGDAARIVEGCANITSKDIYVVVAGLLYTRGLADLLEAYAQSTRNAWR